MYTLPLTTSRLNIRKFVDADFEELFSMLSDPQVMEFSLKGAISKEEAGKYYEERIIGHYEKYGHGFLALIDKSDQTLVGFAGLINQQIGDDERIELAYRLASRYWRKGLATEAVKAIRDYAWDAFDFDSLIAIIDEKNIRSVSVAKKAGFYPLKKTIFYGFDVLIYELRRPIQLGVE